MRLLLWLLLLTRAAQAVPFSLDEKVYHREILRHGGIERSYYVHLPPQYDGKTPLPLLVLLHGGAGGAGQALTNYPLREVADREGFILVAPNGTGPRPVEILRTWNVKFGFGYAQQNQIDDVGFIRALILKLESTHKVDSHRVYLTGLSNGAILCHWAAAANSDLIAGIAPVVGTLGGRDEKETRLLTPAKPLHPVDVIMFNGGLDQHIPTKGGLQERSLGARKFVTSAEETARFWVEANGCHPEAVEEDLPALKATRKTWSRGRRGTQVVLYILHNQGHAWPGGTTPRGEADVPSPLIKAHEELWNFFKRPKA